MEPVPYSQIAPVYDTLMEEVDYRGWAFYITDILSKNGISPPVLLLDLACGTGTATLLLAETGFDLIGLDLSKEMLAAARAKAGAKKKLIDWRQGDMRRFKLDGPVDAAICLFDSVNYLIHESEMVDCFACVRKSLRPGGMFLFDMNTIHALSVNWGNGTKVRQDGEVHSIWRSSYQPCDRTARMELTVFQPEGSGGYRKLREVHVERGYEPGEIEGLLRQAGFGEIEIYKHGTFVRPEPDTARIMITAKA
jgi:SAM-dependent methyltransferase